MIIQTQLTLNRSYGGPARTVPALCSALGELRQDIVLYTSCDNGEDRERFMGENSMKLLPNTGYRAFSRALRNGPNGSLIHDNGLWLGANYAAYRFARQRGIPLVITPHGMLEPWALQHKKSKKKIAWHMYQKRMLHYAEVLHATGEVEADNLRSLGFSQPIAVIPNGVEYPQVLPCPRQKGEKGLENLLRAWAQVVRDGWILHIAGYDQNGYGAQLRRLAEELAVNASVRITGALGDEEKWQHYVDADIFVLPSFGENFGLVIAEAMAAGLVPITSKATPWRMLEQQDCGWWIDVGVDPLVNALQESMGMGEREREQKAQRAQIAARTNFSWRNIAIKTNKLYHWMVAGGDKPGFVV